MTHSPTIDRAVVPHPRNFSKGRGGVRPDCFVLHHQATTNDDATLAMMTSGSRTVSSTVTVSNLGRITGVVEEEDTPYTNGNQAWNRRSFTAEIANLSADGWTISDASYGALARWMADVSTRWGITLSRSTAFGHRELYTKFGAGYATACPGALDLDRVIAEANVIKEEIMPISDEDRKKIVDDVVVGVLNGRVPQEPTTGRTARAAGSCTVFSEPSSRRSPTPACERSSGATRSAGNEPPSVCVTSTRTRRASPQPSKRSSRQQASRSRSPTSRFPSSQRRSIASRPTS